MESKKLPVGSNWIDKDGRNCVIIGHMTDSPCQPGFGVEELKAHQEREAMLSDCYGIGLTPEAAARLIQLVDEFYLNPIVADSFPCKRDYLATMLATQKVPKGRPTATDVEAAKMQLAMKQAERHDLVHRGEPSKPVNIPGNGQPATQMLLSHKPKFSDTIKATM